MALLQALVVDARASKRRSIKSILASNDFDCFTAADEISAMHYVKGFNLDLVVAAVCHLSLGLLEAELERGQFPPLVIYSEDIGTSELAARLGRHAGAIQIAEPFEVDALVDAIGRAFGEEA